jgi:hypothetical protein
MAYAERTSVPVEQSIAEIRKTIARYSGEQFVFGVSEKQILVGFTKEGRQVRFQVAQDPKQPQRNRTLARALLLIIKAKLEAVVSGVSVFEDEFLANVVLPDGKLVAQQVRPSIAAAYEGREMPPMLPDYTQ